MKFLQSILLPGQLYTDAAYADATKTMIPYSHEIMNHDYIGSLACMPNEPKTFNEAFRLQTDTVFLNCIVMYHIITNR